MQSGTNSFLSPGSLPNDGGPNIYLHINGFAAKATKHDFNPQGARVEFKMGIDRRTGKPCAVNAKLIFENGHRKTLLA